MCQESLTSSIDLTWRVSNFHINVIINFICPLFLWWFLTLGFQTSHLKMVLASQGGGVVHTNHQES